MTTEEFKYPDRYAIQQALSQFWQRNQLDTFAKTQGVFITNATQEILADFMSALFFDYEQLEYIRKVALQIDTSDTLSGFKVVSEDGNFDLVNLLDNCRGKTVDDAQKIKIHPIVATLNGDKPNFRGKIEYTQQKPGRVQFLQGTERHFEYYLQQLDMGEWRILINCTRSNDARIMEDWVRKQLPRNSTIATIDQDELTTEQTIEFFDRLSMEGGESEWDFKQVKRLVLRRDTHLSSEDDDSSERIETEVSVLSGITQAILEGNELRNNPFVKQCEEGGYRFTAMTYEFENKNHPYLKEVRAEFKKRPKVFEVSLEKYTRRAGVDEKIQIQPISDEDRIKTLTDFWAMAKMIYDDLTFPETR